jgi:hypothetical protein
VVTDGAARGGAESAVTGKVAGNATDNRAFDAPFGIGRSSDRQKRERGNRAREGLGHVLLRRFVGWLHNTARRGKFLGRGGQAVGADVGAARVRMVNRRGQCWDAPTECGKHVAGETEKGAKVIRAQHQAGLTAKIGAVIFSLNLELAVAFITTNAGDQPSPEVA